MHIYSVENYIFHCVSLVLLLLLHYPKCYLRLCRTYFFVDDFARLSNSHPLHCERFLQIVPERGRECRMDTCLSLWCSWNRRGTSCHTVVHAAFLRPAHHIDALKPEDSNHFLFCQKNLMKIASSRPLFVSLFMLRPEDNKRIRISKKIVFMLTLLINIIDCTDLLFLDQAQWMDLTHSIPILHPV